MYKYDFNAFQEILLDELDSWFSADIACCDKCYENFVRFWTGVYKRDLKFQENSIDINSLYNSTRINEFFSREEFDEYKEDITCPNCGDAISNNIWLYNFEFDIPEYFEEVLEELKNISEITPFMILKHPYAAEVYNEIESIYKKSKKKIFKASFYRGKIDYGTGKPKYSEFTAPPKEKTKEGRYNHYGIPVFYIASNEETCYYELNKPEEGIYIGRFKIKKPLKLLDLLDESLMDSKLLNIMVWTSIMSAEKIDNGYYNPVYTFTRFIADCAKYVGFDGIKYPSVKLGEGVNFVLFNEGMYGSVLNDLNIYKYDK